jgi:GNAT superfamily N-acetyltransferase
MLDVMQSLIIHETTPSDLAHETDIVVRRPSAADIPGVAALFSEMQIFYHRPVSDAAAREAAALACLPPANTFDPLVLVALIGDAIVGSMVMNVTFPAFELTLSLHIRDLYVAATARRSGVGRKLVKAGARLAISEGFSALEWTTDSANTAARKMYEICGAKHLDRAYYRLFDDTLRYAAG